MGYLPSNLKLVPFFINPCSKEIENDKDVTKSKVDFNNGANTTWSMLDTQCTFKGQFEQYHDPLALDPV